MTSVTHDHRGDPPQRGAQPLRCRGDRPGWGWPIDATEGVEVSWRRHPGGSVSLRGTENDDIQCGRPHPLAPHSRV